MNEKQIEELLHCLTVLNANLEQQNVLMAAGNEQQRESIAQVKQLASSAIELASKASGSVQIDIEGSGRA